jgi:predicted nuclease of predicted toxin-antitoxin system
MLVKIDENLPRRLVPILRSRGHAVVRIVEQGMAGWKDSVLWPAVQEEERFFITADKHFGDIREYPPGRHMGILLLRPDEDGVQPLAALLEQVLESQGLESLRGTLTVATPRGIRRRPPED